MYDKGTIIETETLTDMEQRQLRSQLRDLQRESSRGTCKICMVREIDLLLLPCAHACTCRSCWVAMGATRECPVCRVAVSDTVTMVIS